MYNLYNNYNLQYNPEIRDAGIIKGQGGRLFSKCTFINKNLYYSNVPYNKMGFLFVDRKTF
jgi:hypothetical protein